MTAHQDLPKAEAPEAADRRPKRTALLLTVTCMGQFMVLLDSTIVGAALPDMQQRLHLRLDGLQWIVDSYVLLVAMLLLSGGVLADRLGRKRVFLTGATVFTLASVLCAAAPSPGWLIAGRALQGIGAAALSPASLALLAAAHPVPQDRVKAIGLWAGLSGIGLAAGPVAAWGPGGRVRLAYHLPRQRTHRRRPARGRSVRPDRVPRPGRTGDRHPGRGPVRPRCGGAVLRTDRGRFRGWTSPVILGSFAAAVVTLAAFVAVEQRAPAPMLPLRLFRQRLFTVSSAAMAVVGFALMGSSFFFSQFFVHVQGSSILRAGLQTLPVTLAMVVVSPYAGRLAVRYGFRIVVTTGLALAGPGLLALGFVQADTAYAHVWWRLAVTGVGFALTMSPLTGAAIQSVGTHESGLASGVISTTRQIGAVLGVAVLGAVVRTRQSGGASFEQPSAAPSSWQAPSLW